MSKTYLPFQNHASWCVHLVYTPIGCTTSEGHFLSYNTMHLTYITHKFDVSIYPNAGTDVPMK